MVMFEVTVSKPRLSILSEVVTVLVLSGPGDHVMFGLGTPFAVQLNTIESPSSLSKNSSLLGLVITTDPKLNKVVMVTSLHTSSKSNHALCICIS